MMKIWLFLVPELGKVHDSLRKQVLKQASRAELSKPELIAMAVWLVIVSVLTQNILKVATDENRLTFTIVANLFFTAPALLAVFIPIHIRRIRRDIRRYLNR